jgi:hypothetical protein
MDEGTGVRCRVPGGAPGRIQAIGRPSSAVFRCSGHDPSEAYDRPRHAHIDSRTGRRSVLDHSAKAIELEDTEARVAELERAADPAKLPARGTLPCREQFS